MRQAISFSILLGLALPTLSACASTPRTPESADASKAAESAAPGAKAPDESGPLKPPPRYVAMTAFTVMPTPHGLAVLLGDETKSIALPIFIAGTEALSIHHRMEGEPRPRPLTHDLLEAVMRELGGKLVKVQVDSVEEGVFKGTVHVRHGGRVAAIDARPSDAIALAIGADVPIFVAKSVLLEAGIRVDQTREPDASDPQPL